MVYLAGLEDIIDDPKIPKSKVGETLRRLFESENSSRPPSSSPEDWQGPKEYSTSEQSTSIPELPHDTIEQTLLSNYTPLNPEYKISIRNVPILFGMGGSIERDDSTTIERLVVFAKGKQHVWLEHLMNKECCLIPGFEVLRG